MDDFNLCIDTDTSGESAELVVYRSQPIHPPFEKKINSFICGAIILSYLYYKDEALVTLKKLNQNSFDL